MTLLVLGVQVEMNPAAAPNVTLVTIPGSVFLMPDEVPQQIAEVILAALAQAA